MHERSNKPVLKARLHFLILTHGALPETRRCLASLVKTTPLPFQVFVVDNASQDGTQQWLKSRPEPWLHWQCNPVNRGVPGGRNDLLEFALQNVGADDWLVFCDNDLEFGPEWLTPFVQAIEAHEGARILGKVGHFIQVVGDRRHLMPAPVETSPVDVVSGGFACFVRADAARTIGPFDEQLGLFWHEDDDYCVRALQHGFEVIAVPCANIIHHEHASGVATPGLVEGGSLQNQAFLAREWRMSGALDRDGFVRRSTGPYLAPEIRDLLLVRSTRRAPIGRSELAAAMLIIEQVLCAPDPVLWMRKHRPSLPSCLWPLMDLYADQARADGDLELVAQLRRIETTLRTECHTARLLPTLKVATTSTGHQADPGWRHGVCSRADFDTPGFRAVAAQLDAAVPLDDPHAHDRVFWESVRVAQGLRSTVPDLKQSLVFVVGEIQPHLHRWLTSHCLQVVLATSEGSRAAESNETRFGIVILARTTDPDQITRILRRASEETIVVWIGDVVLNGTPTASALQPFQLQYDLLHRCGLSPIDPLRLELDLAVLEACVDQDSKRHARPQLCILAGARLITSAVVFAKPSVVPAPAVMLPAHPRSHGTSIGVDARTLFYSDSTSRGIGHYTTHHLAAVARNAPEMQFVCYVPRPDDVLPQALRLQNITTRAIDAYRSEDVALVHLPDPMNMSLGFDAPLRVFRHERLTMTFHDLTPLHHFVDKWPRPHREAYLDRLRQIEGSHVHLLTNSVFTANDALAHMHLDPTRVTPILAGQNGAGITQRPTQEQIESTLATFGIKMPFVLHVGAHDPHKNVMSVLSAFLHARSRRPLQLVIVGAVDPGVAAMAEYCAKRRVPDVVFTGFLPRVQLDVLYAVATALVFLSKAEGFGFPLLEAMAAGCPVLGSRASSHPEVVGNAGILVELTDVEGAGQAILQLLEQPELVARLRADGVEQAGRFTWDAVARHTLSVWAALLQQPLPHSVDGSAGPTRRASAVRS